MAEGVKVAWSRLTSGGPWTPLELASHTICRWGHSGPSGKDWYPLECPFPDPHLRFSPALSLCLLKVSGNDPVEPKTRE